MTNEQCRSARKLLGMSQPKLAQAIGAKLRVIQYIEAKDSKCTQVTSLAIECLLRRKKLFSEFQR